MQVFYAPDISGNTYILDENESRHLIRVLRMKKGNEVKLIDGRGNLYEGVISEPDQKKCIIAIKNTIHGFEKRSYNLHLAISPLKNPDRFEWFVEKCVEIGVDSITPVICRNTEKPHIRAERIRNIIVSAMKQSLKTQATMLKESVPFSEFVSYDLKGCRMIAHCQDSEDKVSIPDIYTRGSDAVILIGPEGDFTPEEVEMAAERGFRNIHLGKSRLRTETAGIAACHSIYFINL